MAVSTKLNKDMDHTKDKIPKSEAHTTSYAEFPLDAHGTRFMNSLE